MEVNVKTPREVTAALAGLVMRGKTAELVKCFSFFYLKKINSGIAQASSIMCKDLFVREKLSLAWLEGYPPYRIISVTFHNFLYKE